MNTGGPHYPIHDQNDTVAAKWSDRLLDTLNLRRVVSIFFVFVVTFSFISLMLTILIYIKT